MDDVVNAIADPVRRRILDLLRESDLSAGEVSAHFVISRPAVSRHLRVLRESGLVRDRLDGRRRLYGIRPEGLSELGRWIGRFAAPDSAEPGPGSAPGRSAWEGRLDALETEVHRTRRERRGRTRDNREESA
ncbi:metalloregulator ArsR/SmtB family transcription factor [Nocardiopsis alborubida]|uniref:Winged helix-turn-helix transcriptional regulator n=1 Tax=Nocardiopsis alborubida TaxID=146802 RepID=A0A7X6RRU3_9ACTN|nr:metalloregulator ArsR/SmtB family transcription factor [Nocardiopsis alborubida]NKZ00331.1 winged helix-turn-helix transcriptional regulator [Nocardiopsis alborubida]